MMYTAEIDMVSDWLTLGCQFSCAELQPITNAIRAFKSRVVEMEFFWSNTTLEREIIGLFGRESSKPFSYGLLTQEYTNLLYNFLENNSA